MNRTPLPRFQCVQAFETNLTFIKRLLAEEGIYFSIPHGARNKQVTIGDNPGSVEPLAEVDLIPYSDSHGEGMNAGEAVYSLHLSHAVTPTKIALGDFDFEKPDVNQEAGAGTGTLEIHEYPGGYVDPSEGATVAQLRLEEAQRQKVVLTALTTVRRMRPGLSFRVDGAPRDDLAGPWLVVEVTHRAAERLGGASKEPMYEAKITAVPANKPYRPKRLPSPTLGGVQTAVTTGSAGSEIHPDKHGRIKALLRWDRLRPDDDQSSAWLRPIQAPTSGGFLLPRVGWEVLLGFQGTSGDTPYELGRLYNGQILPPEGLPGKKVCTTFGTQTTPGGGSANLLKLDDAAGSEGMTLNASRDFNERTENDKGTTVVGDDVHSVGADHKVIVGDACSAVVDGAQTYSVAANRDVTSVGNFTIQTGSESVTVGGARIFKVGGDYETQASTLIRSVGALKSEVAIQEVARHVTGVATVLVGGSWVEVGGLHSGTGVLGASVLNVGGPIQIKAKEYSLKASALKEDYASRTVDAKAAVTEDFGAAAKYSIGASLKMKGANAYFLAQSKLTIKASGATITMTPGSIKIKGDFKSTEASIVTGKDVNE
ncbi:MAG: type VI secretion system tip protein VgrG [Polyangiaceae bacterium]|nr:type VI secretion system tip protein VgrG [Polyangiaceae bacterium]